MADDSDKHSKTEDPTSKRLEDARKKGQVPNSREVGTALLFLAAILLFALQGKTLWEALQGKMHFLLSGQIQDDLTETGLVVLARELVVSMLWDLAPFFGLFVAFGVLGSLFQHGWIISLESLQPKFSKVNPAQGLKRIFSSRSVIELFKSILKMTVVSLAVYWSIEDLRLEIATLSATSLPYVIELMTDHTMDMVWQVTIVFIVLAVLDFSYQKFDYIKGLRMTKQEVKDEMKQTEGDPLLKGRIRQIQREMAHRRMMQEVPKADVVITNPTHVAVALRYVPGQMSAPQVTAKGRGVVAERIRELARENRVPLVENPPLARTLHRDVDIDHFVPPELFKAVAEVLAYVYGLKNRRAQRAA
ncbi:MAG: flagellar biosynthesis protein FlhB [Magnetococcales bacterium]|nr:flagellar biosynthesis protein FlhB [Magnetococcales bacterium]